MAIRIAGINIPDHKHVRIALTYIYGIGLTTAHKLCESAEVSPFVKMSQLDGEEVARVRTAVAGLTLEGDLKRRVQLNVKRLMDLGCFRGYRHRRGLPVNGQRSKTNAKTCRKFAKGSKRS